MPGEVLAGGGKRLLAVGHWPGHGDPMPLMVVIVVGGGGESLFGLRYSIGVQGMPRQGCTSQAKRGRPNPWAG